MRRLEEDGGPRCWECGKHGHIARECPKRKKGGTFGEEEPRKTQLPSVQHTEHNPLVTHNVFSYCKTSSSNEIWLINSVHLVNDVSPLQNMTVFADTRVLQLPTAGAKGGIVATGSACLLIHEGRNVWLLNVQCVPEASTNLLSVSDGIRDGLNFTVNDSGAYVRVEGKTGGTGEYKSYMACTT